MAKDASIEQLRSAANAACDALRKAEDKERDIENRALVGKTFKYSNSGGGEKRWWLYAKVVGVSDGWLVTFEFETCSFGEIRIRRNNSSQILLSGFSPIRKSEFDAAWRKLSARLASTTP